jgi:glycosyltransferase involved in cell wall biosynthesis
LSISFPADPVPLCSGLAFGNVACLRPALSQARLHLCTLRNAPFCGIVFTAFINNSHYDHALLMKILHIVKTATGATWVYHQVRVLRSLGFEIVVALPPAANGPAAKYRELGATVVPINLDVPTKRPWQIPAVLKSCRTLVKNVRPDIIHTHHVGTTLVVRAALGKSSPIPRIFQVPGTLHLEHAFFAHFDTTLAGPCDHWIASCRWTQRKYLQLGIPPHRVSLSYLGTDVNSFSTTRTNILRRELGLAPSTPLVGMVCYMYAPKRFLGQTVGLKGHEDFIAALQLAKKECPDLHAVIIGGAWNGAIKYEHHLRQLGRKACNGYLSFLDTRSNIPAIYPDVDLAVVASHTENVPHSAVEALLSGVPVVTTNVGGLPDIITEGVSGKLVPARKPQALATAILSSLQNRDEAYRLTCEGQKMARHLFDVQRTAREVAQIYATLTPKSAEASLNAGRGKLSSFRTH